MENIDELVSIGKQYFDQKEFRKAEGYLSKVLEQTDRYADVYNMMGMIQHSEGRFTAAIEHFKRALTINPRYTESLLNLAVLYNDLGQYEDAKRLYGQMKKRPRTPQQDIEPVLRGKLSNLHSNIGDIYRSVGAQKLAIEEYEKALRLNPKYIDIRTKLGQCYREDGQLQKALKELRKTLKVNSNYSPARVQLGLTYYSQGKINEAKKEWKTVLTTSPDNDYASMYLRLVNVMSTTTKKKRRPAKRDKPAR
jgi:tetratricopeptide (TPR) repeat protein